MLNKTKFQNVVKSLPGIMLILIIIGSEMFSQTYNLSINKNDGSFVNVKVSDISKIVFVDCPSTIDDADGNTYNTVVIGEQCWMKENLNVGTRINQGNQQQSGNGIEKYCYNDLSSNCTTYGGLYQWAEAVQYLNGATNSASPEPAFSGNVQGICPVGWHIPTTAELQSLSTAISNSGNALKAVGQGSGAGAGTNTSGFSALLAGTEDTESFSGLTTRAYFWSSAYDSENGYNANYIFLTNDTPNVNFVTSTKGQAFSIRCLKD